MKTVGLNHGSTRDDVAALREIPSERIRVLDTETTGLSARDDEVLQLSIIDGDGAAVMSSYLRPERVRSWPDAERVNHISPAMVEGCPTLSEALPDVQAALDGAQLIIAYNLPFDWPFLRTSGIQWPQGAMSYDPMFEFAPVAGEWHDYFGDYRWQKLSVAAAHYGYEFPPHDALEDTRATLHVFRSLLDDPDYLGLFDS